MAMGPAAKAPRRKQPTNLNVRKAGQSNINTRGNSERSTTSQNSPGRAKPAPVRKIGTPYNLPDVPRPF